MGVVASAETPPYRDAATGFRERLREAGYEVEWKEETAPNPAEAGVKVRSFAAAGVQLILALGAAAAQGAAREAGTVPVISGLVMRRGGAGPAGKGTGVFLELPPEIELELIRAAFPQDRRVAVLFSTDENRERVEMATATAKRLGLTLLPTRVADARELPMALDQLASRADVIWGMSDPVVYTQETARPLLLFSFRNRIPLVGFSVAWAKAGAVLAIDRDYRDIGRQCGDMAMKVLGGQAPSSLAPENPRKTAWTVNLKSAETIKVEIPEDIVRLASEVIR